MTLRHATVHDLDQICSLIEALADYEHMSDQVGFDRRQMADHLFAPDPVAHVILAEDAGEVVGFALWFWSFSTFLGRPGIWLEDLFVRPDFRGRGHGRALIDRVRSLTDGRVEWSVLDWNEPAIAFYQRLGARPVDGWTTYRWLLD
jgi:GNAT superfamily N-acetyltransferase